jgi:hypothetical protein
MFHDSEVFDEEEELYGRKLSKKTATGERNCSDGHCVNCVCSCAMCMLGNSHNLDCEAQRLPSIRLQ